MSVIAWHLAVKIWTTIVEVLLSGFGSGVEDTTVAVLLNEDIALVLTVPRIAISLVSWFISVPILRLPVQGKKVTPPSTEYSAFKNNEGIVSFKVTLSADDGPALWILISNVNSSPGVTGLGLAVFITEISANVCIVTATSLEVTSKTPGIPPSTGV